MGDTVLATGIAEAKGAISQPKDLKDALVMAMKCTKDFWLSLDDDLRFRAAIGATMEFYGKDSEEWGRLSQEMSLIRQFSAFLQASQVGLEVSPPNVDECTHEPIGLIAIWNDVKTRKL